MARKVAEECHSDKFQDEMRARGKRYGNDAEMTR